jgi:hypothetical protein
MSLQQPGWTSAFQDSLQAHCLALQFGRFFLIFMVISAPKWAACSTSWADLLRDRLIGNLFMQS